MFTEQRRYGRDPEIVTRCQTWRDPIRWQKAAQAEQRYERVFTCSWSDWFHEAADPWRDEAWAIVRACSNLHFQILTKRIDRVAEHLPLDWEAGYKNVWLGVSIENDRFTWRADVLRTIPARVRFVSAEPLLAPLPSLRLDGIDWLIVGGESGQGYRPMKPEWAEDLYRLAAASGCWFWFKQSAATRTETGVELNGRIIREIPALW